jgi:hypothetical protein
MQCEANAQGPVHRVEFFELQVGQLQDVEHVLHVVAEVDDHRSVPVDHDQVRLRERALQTQHLADLWASLSRSGAVSVSPGHLPAVCGQPVIDVLDPFHLGETKGRVGERCIGHNDSIRNAQRGAVGVGDRKGDAIGAFLGVDMRGVDLKGMSAP